MYGTGGKVNRMSDDLISRKSLIENLNKFAPEHYTALVNDLIMKEQTAFDKGKVLEELKKHADIAIETNEAYGSEVAFGEWSAYKQAEEIVKKGGIE